MRRLVACLAVVLAAASAMAESASPLAPESSPPPGRRAVSAPEAAPRLQASVSSATLLVDASPAVRYLGAVSISVDSPLWGGLSGLTVSGNGRDFLAVSDRTRLFAGRFVRDGSGAVTSVTDLRAHPLRDSRGRALTFGAMDAEGLAGTTDGPLWLSFEGRNEIWGRARPGGPARRIMAPPALKGLPFAEGPEALAIAPDGALLVIAEGAADGGFPILRRAPDGAWSAAVLPPSGDFAPTGADFGPDGRLYVVERAFSLFGGFAARVRRMEMASAVPGRIETLLTLRAPRDNFEALALWRDASGGVRMSLLADDNFSPLQRTVLAEFAILDAAPEPPTQ